MRNRIWLQVFWSKLTCLLCGGSKLTVGVEINLFHVWWSIEFFLCCRSKLPRLLYTGRKSLRFSEHRNWLGLCLGDRYWFAFSVGNRTGLDFSVWIGIDLVLSGGRKWLGFRIWIEIDMYFLCSTANRCGLLIDRCVGNVVEDYSVTVDSEA